ncbi:MAG: hypothetical protein R2748_26240 [Bryobacterales bacterium]
MGSSGGAPAFPGRGWVGLAAIASAVGLGFWDQPSFASILAWWGLALGLDGASFAVRGRSVLEDAPEALVWMAVLSIFLGVGLEWSAAQVGSWAYLGLPGNEFVRYAVQGATFAAFVPALHGAALLLGAHGEPGKARGGMLRIALGAILVAAVLLFPNATPEEAPVMALPGALLIGVWLFCSGANGLRGRADSQNWVWITAGLLLLGWTAVVTALTGQGRYPGGFESPGLWEYLLLAALGPSMRAAYLLLADSSGLPTWPARESRTSLIR